MTPTVRISTTDTATTEMQRIAGRMTGPELREAVAQAATEEVRETYVRLDRERPNQLGGARQHFFAQAAESAFWTDFGDAVEIDVTEPLGLRQRILGGPITPGKGVNPKTGLPPKYLTLAATAEAYGHRAGEFTDLVPLFRRRGGVVEAYALAKAEQQPVTFKKGGGVRKGKAVGGGGRATYGEATVERARPVMFWLVKSVNQKADPSCAPDEQRVQAAGKVGLARFFSSLLGEVRG